MEREQRRTDADDGRDLDALPGEFLLALTKQIPATHTYTEHGTDDPRRGDRMKKLINCKRREGHVGERGHLIAHRIGIERTSYRILHPGVGHKDPPGRDRGTQTRQPRRREVEARTHLLPAKEHHGNEGRLHEKGHNTLDGQRRAKDIAYEPGIIRPVGSELKLENDTRCYTHGKIDTEQTLPETRHVLPEHLARTVITSLGNAHDHGEAKCQRNKKPVVDRRQGKLRT